MRILSCGAGMQSTALALMACANALFAWLHPGEPLPFPLVPIYDLIIFCDLGAEPPWVYEQVAFIGRACQKAGIAFLVLYTELYDEYMLKFGRAHVPTIPFWSIGEDGSKARMKRTCTLEFKILAIQAYFKREVLGYRYAQHTRSADKGNHEMHLGFSNEESQRAVESKSNMFENKYPLIEMGLERRDNYAYCLNEWGLDTKASACIMCPFHTNYFFLHMKRHFRKWYDKLVAFDRMIAERQPFSLIRSKLFISKSRKRIEDLREDECDDMETFEFRGEQRWNGF